MIIHEPGACTCTHLTCRVASLNHELFDNSVKDVAIVVATTSVHTEVLHCLRAAESQYRTQHTCYDLRYLYSQPPPYILATNYLGFGCYNYVHVHTSELVTGLLFQEELELYISHGGV